MLIIYCIFHYAGRFGNQADHFLGALSFANGLNRTLILPPWVEYRYGESRSIQVPFKTYFKVEPLKKYHKVITMEEFMSKIAEAEWPPEKRVSFCYMQRGDNNNCNAKEGNPFGPFWDTFNIDFVGSEFYGPLHYDTHYPPMAQKWKESYPPAKWSVLAFTGKFYNFFLNEKIMCTILDIIIGAPASFPVQKENVGLCQYMEWSDEISSEADEFIKYNLPNGAFMAIHLRNGIDWVRACQHIPQSPNLFAAAQCLGYQNEHGNATEEMCLPSKNLVIRTVKHHLKLYNDQLNHKNRPIKSLFVASDNDHMLEDLNIALKRMKIKAYKLNRNSPMVDLAILSKSTYFIGNCISSYSGFVIRYRKFTKKGHLAWFGHPTRKSRSKHDEL